MARGDISEEIERLSAERRALWSSGVNGDDCKRLTALIESLYAEKREAAASHGTPAMRERQLAAAKADEQLEKLMSS